MAELLKGAPVAQAISRRLTEEAAALRQEGLVPCLAILRVGERPDDLSYEGAAMRRCAQIGIQVRSFLLPADCRQAELMAALEEIGRDSAIHGCLMFRPLPPHLDERAACEALPPEKDVDGMTSRSLSAVFLGEERGFAPCTALACLELLSGWGVDLAGKRAAVIGRSLVIGKPLAMLLQDRDATVTICHSKSPDLPGICRQADILVVAAGRPGVVGPDFCHEAQVVIDVGVNAAPGGGICGDVDFDRVAPLVRAISPVPGGVGAVTTAVLCQNLLRAARRSRER